MKNQLSQFIQDHWNGQSPLLLALSGGPDSILLLQLLLELKTSLPFKLAIAHVDHHWRSSSELEAKQLEEMVAKLGLNFHLKTLSPSLLTKNLEAACRLERLKFFRELCFQYGYQAVFLGHHADDQAETVLKKIFEGVSLPYLSALHPVTAVEGLTLWRPFLSCRKKEILNELKSYSVEPIDDETNKDPRYLRARFRTKLLPLLTQEFGKEMSSHLNNLNAEAQELNAYLDSKTTSFYSDCIEGPFGSMLDFKEIIAMTHLLEQRHLVRRFCRDNNLPLSKNGLDMALRFLVSGAANKTISCGKRNLYIDRYCLFALKNDFADKQVPEPLELSLGEHDFCNWKVSVERVNSEEHKSLGWRDVWRGNTQTFLASSSYQLSFPKLGDCYPNSSLLRHWWNKNKIPVFMRSLVPIILCDGKIVHEFLSGKTKMQKDSKECLRISIKW